MFEHANIKKHVYEHSCLSVRVFLSISAYLAYLAKSFDLKCDEWINILILASDEWINILILASRYKKACLWAELLICVVYLSIPAHLAHLADLAQPFFLIFDGMNKNMFLLSTQMQRRIVSEHSWLSGWVILNI